MSRHVWITHSPEATFAFGAALGQVLVPGTCLALSGPLGSGKTQFVKGVARGLGVPDSEPVVSPTFVLMRAYAGRAVLYHLDTYRLANADELVDLGFEEMLDTGGVVAVEWADRTPEVIPPDAWWLTFEHGGFQEHGGLEPPGPNDRRITLQRQVDLDPALLHALDTLAEPAEPAPIDNPQTPPDTTS